VGPDEFPGLRFINERYIQMKGTSKAKEVSAPDLAKLAIEAHGGLEHWHRLSDEEEDLPAPT
jgi:hypothetical protein